MKYVTILENGKVWPSLKENDSIVAINSGVIRMGRYNRKNYLKNLFYLDSPFNEQELISELVQHIKLRNKNLLQDINDLDLLFVCPKEISSKFVWNKNKIEKVI